MSYYNDITIEQFTLTVWKKVNLIRKMSRGGHPLTEQEPISKPQERPSIYTASQILDGDIIQAIGDADVYIVKIVGEKRFKRLILNPTIFDSYDHLKWENIKIVSKSTLDMYTLSNVVQEVNPDGSIADVKLFQLFGDGDTGEKRHIQLTYEQFKNAGIDIDSIYYINKTEAGDTFYNTGIAIDDIAEFKEILKGQGIRVADGKEQKQEIEDGKSLIPQKTPITILPNPQEQSSTTSIAVNEPAPRIYPSSGTPQNVKTFLPSREIRDLPRGWFVRGLISHKGNLYVRDDSGGEASSSGIVVSGSAKSRLIQIDPNNPGDGGTVVGFFPDEIPSPELMAYNNEVLYVADNNYELRTIDPSNLGRGSTLIGLLPERNLDAMAFHNGILYAVGGDRYQLWQIDLSDPENSSSIVGDLPGSIEWPDSMTSRNGILYIQDINDFQLWKIDPRSVGSDNIVDGELVGNLQGAGFELTSHNGSLYSSNGLDLLQTDLSGIENALPPVKDITVTQKTSNLIRLDWENVTGATQYKVKWQKNNVYLGEQTIDVNRARVEELDPGTVYKFKVIALSSTGEGLEPAEWTPVRTKGVNNQIIGSVPTDYTTSATITWTGGSLYQLKTRLMTLGCTADVIEVYDQSKNKWFKYTQYSAPHSSNQEFHDNYPQDYIPASTIQIPNCYDMCTFEYVSEALDKIMDEVANRLRAWIQEVAPSKSDEDIDEEVDELIEDIVEGYRTRHRCRTTESVISEHPTWSTIEGLECNQDWDPRIIEHVFPIMPTMQDFCIIRAIGGSSNIFHGGNYSGMASAVEYGIDDVPIGWFPNSKPYTSIYREKSERTFFTELHEICHSQQDWYVAQLMSQHDVDIEDKGDAWDNTPAGKALIELTDYQYINSLEEIADDEDYWDVPSDWSFPRWLLTYDSPYREIYKERSEYKQPLEVAAEFCAMKLYFGITGRENTHKGYTPETLELANDWLNEYVFVLE